jgi:SAM-dependent methyltransferase
MDAQEWDERYSGSDSGLWSGRPNGVLVVELEGHAPGSALDVGCGEGADAVWLARAGWTVTGLDVSQTALERAAEAAQAAGVEVEWICSGIEHATLAPGGYDLVSLHYPALEQTPGDDALNALLGAVAPGGALLVVGHWPLDEAFARSHGIELADYVQVGDVRAALGRRWTVEVDEVRPRVDPAPAGAAFTHDAVLRARRAG